MKILLFVVFVLVLSVQEHRLVLLTSRALVTVVFTKSGEFGLKLATLGIIFMFWSKVCPLHWKAMGLYMICKLWCL